MLLGLDRVIGTQEVEAGHFYLRHNYNGEPIVFQAVLTGQIVDGEPEIAALEFFPDTPTPFSLGGLPFPDPVLKLPDVYIRVDAPSVTETSRTSSIRSGMFIVAGDEAFVAAPLGFRNWALMNLSTGRPAEAPMPSQWMSFSRWLLVIDEAGEEIPIARFGKFDDA